MKSRFILPLIMAICATTIIVLNIIFNDISWLRQLIALLAGFVNGYCIYQSYREYVAYKQDKKLFEQALKRFLHYAEWQATHEDMSIEDYVNYHGERRV